MLNNGVPARLRRNTLKNLAVAQFARNGGGLEGGRKSDSTKNAHLRYAVLIRMIADKHHETVHSIILLWTSPIYNVAIASLIIKVAADRGC